MHVYNRQQKVSLIMKKLLKFCNIKIKRPDKIQKDLFYLFLDGDMFYLVVWGHGQYSKAKLVIGGMNFKTAKECRGRECGDIEVNKPLSQDKSKLISNLFFYHRTLNYQISNRNIHELNIIYWFQNVLSISCNMPIPFVFHIVFYF